MTDELVFYTHPQSRGRTVRWMLEEVGRPYRTEVMIYGGSMKSAEYLAINPMGKVPAITHGGTVVTETGAICAYLADAFPDAGLAPPLGDAARGPYFRWMFYAAGPIELVICEKALGMVPPEDRRVMVGHGRVEDVLNALEQAVCDVDYVAGGRFSAADVYFGAAIGFGMSFGMIEKRPAFERYVARISARPAAVRAREIDDALAAELAPPAS